jgi:glycosyltransferase involved in cell wall biosynthesis
VTPSYNQASYLEQTLQSVLEQDYQSIEYNVVDGSSTDGSVNIIKKYANRLAWWVSEKDRGQGEAINKGLAHTHGEILAWLNSDDYYLPNAISSAVKIFEQNADVVLVYGDMLAVDTHGETTNVLKYKQYSLEDLLCFQIIGQPAVFFRREVYEKAGGVDISYHYMLDHHLWIRIAQQGKILHVPQIWAAARYHPQAKNRLKPLDFGREAFRILEWMKGQPDLSGILAGVEKRAIASANRVNARYFLDAGQPDSSLRYWFRAFVIHPPTAFQRLNIFISAVLQLLGFNQLREVILRRRRRAYSSKKQKP